MSTARCVSMMRFMVGKLPPDDVLMIVDEMRACYIDGMLEIASLLDLIAAGETLDDRTKHVVATNAAAARRLAKECGEMV